MARKRLRLAGRRAELGYTQESLAETVRCDRTTIIRWENAQADPQPWQRPPLAKALRVTPAELTLMLDDITDLPADRHHPGTRNPPASTPAAHGGPPDEGGLHDLRARIAAARSIDRGIAASLQQQVNAIRLLDRRVGAPAVADQLEAHIAYLETGLRWSLRPGTRRQLAGVLGDAAALAGWQAIDMGLPVRAWEHFEQAIAAAREAGDASLLAFASAERAYVLLDIGQPYQALDMVTAARQDAGTAVPDQMRGWLHAAEAEMAAAAADPGRCRRALDQAAHVTERHTAGEGLPYLALDAVHLARWRGNCLVLSGDPQAADDLEAALGAMDATFTRASAGLYCDLAAARLAGGELAEARRHLAQAGELARITRSARQQRRVAGLGERVREEAGR